MIVSGDCPITMIRTKACNIYSVTDPFYKLCKVIGLFPNYNTGRVKRDDGKNLVRLWGLLWSLTVVTILVVCFVYRITKTIFEEYNYVKSVIWVPDIIASSVTYISGIMCIIISANGQSVKLNAVELEIDAIERHFCGLQAKSNNFNKLGLALIIIVVFMVVLMVSTSYAYIYLWRSYFNSYVLFGEHYCYIIFYLIFVKYVFYVRVLHGYFKELNIHIMSALDNKTVGEFDKIEERTLNTTKCFEVVIIEDFPLRDAEYESKCFPDLSVSKRQNMVDVQISYTKSRNCRLNFTL